METRKQTKMKTPKLLNFPLLLSATLLMLQTRCQALTDVLPSADEKMATSQQQQQVQQLQQHHNRMSCYVCSTMDYENTSDNLCKVMKPHHRTPANFHQQPPNLVSAGLHPTSMMSYPPQTTTTTSTTTAASTRAATDPNSSPLLGTTTNQNVMSPNEAYYASSTPSGYYDESTQYGTEFNHQQPVVTHNNNITQQYDDSQLVNTNSSSAQHHQSTFTTPAHHGYYPQNQHRMWPPSNHIRTRQCLEDENFCSIVSVVRIEVVNDSLSSRFWAMERNCSKSCNTGCMLIGERVRLRVCSQCCRTPNCNIRSGAPAVKLTLSPYHHLLQISLLLSITIIISLADGLNLIKLRE